MKIMYLARFARDELKRAIGHLATKFTVWDDLCDQKLYRIIRFMVGSHDWRQLGFLGDNLKDLKLA